MNKDPAIYMIDSIKTILADSDANEGVVPVCLFKIQ